MLLDAAVRAFAQDGFYETRIDRVAASAGVAKGTIYHYFPSKAAVFYAALRDACDLAGDAGLAVPDAGPIGTQLEAFVEGNLAWARTQEALAVLFARELIGGRGETRRVIVTALTPCLDKVTEMVRAADERGELYVREAPRTVALKFVELVNLFLLRASNNDEWPPVDTFAATVSSLFLYGVAARS
jgi:AcrR family transcriptional regulator